jgi:putative ABC transport system substrate-binding protein
VDVVITTGTVPTSAAQAASSTIPIVMVGTEDPVGSGFAGSLARPGGNITGLSTMAVQLNGKRLELLKQIVPGASRVAVLWNPAIPERASEFPETEIAARALGLEVVSLEVREASGLEAAFDAAVGERSTALLTLDNLVTTNNRSRIVGLATKSRVPMMSQRQEMAYAGGLLAYAPDTVDQRRRAAIFVDKILKGARPGDLPIEQPTKIDFIVNLKTAEALGISIPQSVLAQATEVIR